MAPSSSEHIRKTTELPPESEFSPAEPITSDLSQEEPSWAELYDELGLRSFRMDDADAAQAYDQTPPERRARLKTAIAFQCQLWGEAASSETRASVSRATGFSQTLHECPAAWTLAVVDPGHAAPARLLAALMPAVLAGSEHILVVSTGALLAPALRVALELAGLEDVFILPVPSRTSCDGDTVTLLTRLYDWNANGRLLLFPSPKTTLFLPMLQVTARRLGIRSWQDIAEPHLLLLSDRQTEEREEIIRWAHGDARLTVWKDCQTTSQSAKNYAACYSDDGSASIASEFPLCLGPGLEACWLSVNRSFFRTVSCAASFF